MDTICQGTRIAGPNGKMTQGTEKPDPTLILKQGHYFLKTTFSLEKGNILLNKVKNQKRAKIY